MGWTPPLFTASRCQTGSDIQQSQERRSPRWNLNELALIWSLALARLYLTQRKTRRSGSPSSVEAPFSHFWTLQTQHHTTVSPYSAVQTDSGRFESYPTPDTRFHAKRHQGPQRGSYRTLERTFSNAALTGFGARSATRARRVS